MNLFLNQISLDNNSLISIEVEQVQVLPIAVQVEVHHRHNFDDLFYPKSRLKQMASDGVDISSFQAITGMFSDESKLGTRGVTKSTNWDDLDPNDNKIVVPYSFHKDYPEDFKAAAIFTYEKMNSDLSCIKLEYVDSEERKYINGILIVEPDDSAAGCFSALGKSPGFVGLSGVHSISELGAPSGWQVLACDGLDEGYFQHEMLHALGVEHEHSRQDRDNYLNVILTQQQRTLNLSKWTMRIGCKCSIARTMICILMNQIL